MPWVKYIKPCSDGAGVHVPDDYVELSEKDARSVVGAGVAVYEEPLPEPEPVDDEEVW